MASIGRMGSAGVLVASFAACLLVAPGRADEPGKEGPLLKGWGRVTDPDGDCAVALRAGAVEFRIPGKPHDFAADIEIQNSPRVLREVAGDFVVEVKVEGELRPGATSTIPGRLSYHGGGLVAIRDKDNYISLHRGCVNFGDRVRHYANFELRKDGTMPISLYQIEIPDQDAYLRLERRGNQMLNATSPDGIHWSSYEPIALELPRSIQIGIVGVSSSDVPLAIRFRDLALFRKVEAD